MAARTPLTFFGFTLSKNTIYMHISVVNMHVKVIR